MGPCIGEYCFYKSASHGWIPAKVICKNADNTYDLNVKQRVCLSSICCIWEGDLVEYNSASLGCWIAARICRPGRTEGTFDLDCKESVEVQRMRPASDTTSHMYVAHKDLTAALNRNDPIALRS